jgi:hypothetical protein
MVGLENPSRDIGFMKLWPSLCDLELAQWWHWFCMLPCRWDHLNQASVKSFKRYRIYRVKWHLAYMHRNDDMYICIYHWHK